METKLFKHPYINEAEAARINRLEKFVFGAQNSDASIKERLNRLSACLPTKTIASCSSAAPTSPTAPSALPADFSKYPRVTQLELTLIGKSYFGEPIAKRLSRLELSQFGMSSTSTDLAERADRLCAGFIQTVSDAPKRVQITTVVDQIEYLENKTFGKIRPTKTLQKRVSALEKSYYGSAKSEDETLTLRVSQLLSSINSGSVKADMHS